MKKLLFLFLALTLIAACSKTEEKKVENTDQQTVAKQETSKPEITH